MIVAPAMIHGGPSLDRFLLYNMSMSTSPDFQFEEEVGLFLATCRTASLATVSSDHTPHAANIQYVNDEHFQLYWVSEPNALHSQHLTRHPQTAATIYARDDEVDHLHGLQLHGSAQKIDGGSDQWHHAWDMYTQKFRFVAAMPQFRQLVEQQAFYCLTPTWLRWIDNRRGFGFKVERHWNA